MWTRQYKQKKYGRFILPILTVAFVGYFGYHAIHGEYGLKATERFEALRQERQAELDKLIERRKQMERHVALLSDGSLEKDILDEKARYALNVSKANEIIIFH